MKTSRRFLGLCFVFFLFCYSAEANISEPGFLLNGYLKGKYKGFIFLKYSNNKKVWIKDSCKVINGSFQFKGKVNQYTQIVYISTKESFYDLSKEKNAARIELDNSKMNIQLKYNHFKNFRLQNCKSYNEFQKNQKTLNRYLVQLEKYYKEQALLKNDSLTNRINYNLSKISSINIIYCVKHPNSNISPRLLYEWSNIYDRKILENTYLRLSDIQKESYYGLKTKDIIQANTIKFDQIGSIAPAFTAIDKNEKKFSFDNKTIRGYLLLDFWATWCVPCRKSHHFLKNIYNKYSRLGFDIVSIADNDNDKESWQNAIVQDSINSWTQILRGYANKLVSQQDIAILYHVESYPTRILINSKGIIIARLEDDADLEKKLKDIFLLNDKLLSFP